MADVAAGTEESRLAGKTKDQLCGPYNLSLTKGSPMKYILHIRFTTLRDVY